MQLQRQTGLWRKKRQEKEILPKKCKPPLIKKHFFEGFYEGSFSDNPVPPKIKELKPFIPYDYVNEFFLIPQQDDAFDINPYNNTFHFVQFIPYEDDMKKKENLYGDSMFVYYFYLYDCFCKFENEENAKKTKKKKRKIKVRKSLLI